MKNNSKPAGVDFWVAYLPALGFAGVGGIMSYFIAKSGKVIAAPSSYNSIGKQNRRSVGRNKDIGYFNHFQILKKVSHRQKIWRANMAILTRMMDESARVKFTLG